MTTRPALAFAVLLAACSGATGTVDVSLTTAPGSKLLDGVQQLKLILTAPHQETEAMRTDGGFALTLDLPASGGAGSLIVEGFDAGGALIAVGQSPPFAIAGITARIVVYMAPPMSINPAPLTLSPARSELAVGSVSYGVLFAGGRDATGAPSDATAIYNAFDHSITPGLALPSPRAGLALALDATGHAILFGGTGTDGQPTDTLWGFDTTVAPSGAYNDLGDQAGFARSDQIAVATGSGQFVISGSPVVEFSTTTSSLVARTDIASLPAVGVGLTTTDSVITAVFAGTGTDTGFARFRNDVIDTPNGGDSQRAGGAIAAFGAGQVAFVGGTDQGSPNTAIFTLDAATGVSQVLSSLQIARSNPGIAATSRYLVVAGGTDPGGSVLASVEVLDATSTSTPLVTTLALTVPRTSPTLITLPNDSVLIAGGLDGNGQPIETLELFTPDPPPASP